MGSSDEVLWILVEARGFERLSWGSSKPRVRVRSRNAQRRSPLPRPHSNEQVETLAREAQSLAPLPNRASGSRTPRNIKNVNSTEKLPIAVDLRSAVVCS